MKPQFKTAWTHRGKVIESPVEPTPGLARTHIPSGVKGPITLLRDSGGSDHPENAGKFFLHQIIQ